MKEMIQAHIEHNIQTKQRVLAELVPQIEQAAQMIIAAIKDRKKVLFFGNGGSASDAQHLAAEFVGRFEKDRPGLPAIALTTDTSILTSVANDYSFDVVFERQIAALGQSGDVAVGISTSGNSENVNRAIKKSKEMKLKTIAFSGRDGGKLAPLADIAIVIPSDQTSSIQESHITIGHVICRLIDKELFGLG